MAKKSGEGQMMAKMGYGNLPKAGKSVASPKKPREADTRTTGKRS